MQKAVTSLTISISECPDFSSERGCSLSSCSFTMVFLLHQKSAHSVTAQWFSSVAARREVLVQNEALREMTVLPLSNDYRRTF